MGRERTTFSAAGLSTAVALNPGQRVAVYNEAALPWWKKLLRIKPRRTAVFTGVIVEVNLGWDGQSFEAVSWGDWLLEHTVPPSFGQQVVQKAGLARELRAAIRPYDPSEDKG
jgi:hypothetical protein